MKSKISNEDKSFSLTPTVFNILVVLSGGERHGYAILREVEEIAKGKSRLGPTTLYRSIRTMLESGLIEELGERPDPQMDDERRRYYRLTGFGSRVLNEEVEKLEGLLKVARGNSILSGNRRTANAEH
ncbi:MAG: PadR family transcriptional regulator [Pyrinomonadaceae bacterium]